MLSHVIIQFAKILAPYGRRVSAGMAHSVTSVLGVVLLQLRRLKTCVLVCSGKVPKGLKEAKGFKSGSSGATLSTQTTAKPVGVQPDLVL